MPAPTGITRPCAVLRRCPAHRCGPPISGPAPDWYWPDSAAEGVTEVHEVSHIDRGYPHFVEDLQSLGAKIERIVL